MVLSRIEQMVKMCSTVPFMPDRSPSAKSLGKDFMEQFGDHRGKGNGVEVAGLGGVIPPWENKIILPGTMKVETTL